MSSAASIQSYEVHVRSVSNLRPLFLWENPVRTSVTLGEILAVLFMVQNSDFLRIFLRIIWLSIGGTLLLELATKFLNGGRSGLISSYRPSKSLLPAISPEQLQAHSIAIASVLEEILYWLKRALDARDTSFTIMAFIAVWALYLVTYIASVASVFILAVIGAFTIPPLVVRFEPQIAHARAATNAWFTQKSAAMGAQFRETAPGLASYYDRGLSLAGGMGLGAAGGAAAMAAAAPAAPTPAPMEAFPQPVPTPAPMPPAAASFRSGSVGGAPSIRSGSVYSHTTATPPAPMGAVPIPMADGGAPHPGYPPHPGHAGSVYSGSQYTGSQYTGSQYTGSYTGSYAGSQYSGYTGSQASRRHSVHHG